MSVLNKKKSDKDILSRTESLQCIPVKNNEVREIRLESGNVLLCYPLRLARPWLASLIKKFNSSDNGHTTKKIQLDTLGTSVWDLMDNHRSVQEIIQCFSKMYQLDYKEAEVSVTIFIRDMGRRGLIGLTSKENKTD